MVADFTWTHLAPFLRSTVSVTLLFASLVGVMAHFAFTSAPRLTTFPFRPLSRSVILGLDVSTETEALASGPTLPAMSVARQVTTVLPSAETVTALPLVQAPSPILYSTKSTPEPLPSSPVNESGTGWVTQVAGTPSMADTGPVVSSLMVALTGSEMLPSESWN